MKSPAYTHITLPPAPLSIRKFQAAHIQKAEDFNDNWLSVLGVQKGLTGLAKVLRNKTCDIQECYIIYIYISHSTYYVLPGIHT